MSPETIRDMTEKAGMKAANLNRKPYCFWDNQIKNMKENIAAGAIPDMLRKLPNIGDYVPDGMELVETYFTDATGFDINDAGGPAMSIKEFINLLSPDRSYAIIEVGQFQVMIGAFKNVESS